eukprot:XP_016656760.1 PREDICTED: uncharacterized protein LOC107882642 [Acyrthosiphon pisum]
MMHAFRKMLYAQTYEEAQEKYVETMNIRSNYPMWQKYITVHHWKYKENWCLAWRDHTNRGHQTNNFSEVSVRIFKENVFGRVKAYNVISLIDFCCTKLEEYYKKKFSEFSNERNSTARLFFKKLIKQTDYITKEDITVDNEEFYVPSEKNKKMMYCVEPNIGVCSCEAGIHGQFCDRAPPPTFYESLIPTETLHQHDETNKHIQYYEPNQIVECNKEVSIENNMKIDKQIVDTFKEDMDKKKSFLILKDIHSIMINNVTKFGGSSYDSLLKFKSRLEKIKSEGQFNTFLATAGSKSTLLRQRDGAAIRVQPTTISQRKPGMTRGSKRLPSGRPASTDHSHQKKKPRNLFKNVSDCVPNAKSH